MFRPATRKKLKGRIALDGPAGAGKTYTAIEYAMQLAGPSGRVAVIDTEHRSASKYIGPNPAAPAGRPWQFDVCELDHYAPSTYAQVIREAGRVGYDVLVIDSLSHAWEGTGGALDQVDRKGGNSFTAWKEVTPQHRDMVEAILASPCHVVVTMRTKMDYILEEQVNKQGKTVQVPKKVGMAPIQRQGMEYEFDLVCDLTVEHLLTVSKSRCPAMDGLRASKPGPQFIAPFIAWLDEGERVSLTEPSVIAPTPSTSAYNPDWRTAPLGAVYEARNNDPATPEQQQHIRENAAKLSMTADELRAVLAKRGANIIADLNYAVAQHLIDSMAAKISEANGGNDCPF
jgi:hypothetical protein